MDSKTLGNRGSHWAQAIGRMKPGVTVQKAHADLTLIASRLEQQYPDSNYKVGALAVSLHEDLAGKSRSSLLMMLSAVGLVLSIACANVANLLLSRAVARQKEMRSAARWARRGVGWSGNCSAKAFCSPRASTRRTRCATNEGLTDAAQTLSLPRHEARARVLPTRARATTGWQP